MAFLAEEARVLRPLLIALLTAASAAAQTHEHTAPTSGVPSSGDRVRVSPRHDVVYDVASDARLDCIQLDGRLAFRTDRDTRLRVANLTVMDAGALEIGTEQTPVAREATAEIIIADQKIDGEID